MAPATEVSIGSESPHPLLPCSPLLPACPARLPCTPCLPCSLLLLCLPTRPPFCQPALLPPCLPPRRPAHTPRPLCAPAAALMAAAICWSSLKTLGSCWPPPTKPSSAQTAWRGCTRCVLGACMVDLPFCHTGTLVSCCDVLWALCCSVIFLLSQTLPPLPPPALLSHRLCPLALCSAMCASRRGWQARTWSSERSACC
jgi:hypothetical protein